MIYSLLTTLLIASVNSIHLEDFIPFNGHNGDKVCLVDTDTGLIHTSNTLDEFGKHITKLNPDDCDEYRFSSGDDFSSHLINIPVTFPFFANSFTRIFVNANGVISFSAPFSSYDSTPFPIAKVFLVAPFWADVDTRGTGEIYFKETTNDCLLTLVKNIIQYGTYQTQRFKPKWLLIVTWHQVGYYNTHIDQTNTFQAVLATDGSHSFAIFNYLDEGMNWSKGDASTLPAQVGFNFGGEDMVDSYTLPGYGMKNVYDSISNVKTPGHLIYRIDDVVSQPYSKSSNGLVKITNNATKLIKNIDSTVSPADLQREINNIFSNFPLQEDHPLFIEFGDDNTNEISNLLLQLANTDGIEAALVLAKRSIVSNHLNPNLVKLALGIFLTHNPEAQKLNVIPPSLHLHNQFKSNPVAPLSNPVTADTFKGVNILSYFREDYDLNDHHWHWHIVYPYTGFPENGKLQRTIDRQGELFLYMHSQMIARYNAELLSWDLNLLHAWEYDDILPFGYDPVPGLRDQYGARPPFKGWYEDHNPYLNGSEGFPSIKTMTQWKDNVILAIHNGYFVTKKTDGSSGKLNLTEENAYNWVGVVVEAEDHPLQEITPGSGEFIDRQLYGSVHNYGHNKFAEIGYHEYASAKNPLGVMVSSFGAPRDPCFWLWHRHLDDLRQLLVNKYSHDLNEFKPDGLEITSFKIIPDNPYSKTPMGGVTTFLESPQLHLNEDNAKLTHEPYRWEIEVKSINETPPNSSHPQYFTVRLFIAPAELIDDQRSWIEMDKFTYNFTSAQETITRRDVYSSVARRIGTASDSGNNALPGCGWPQGMMLPVGKPDGAPYVAFVMLTDDKLYQDNSTQSTTFCGVTDHKYPDPRGMGYPFNKTWKNGNNSAASVKEIIADLPHTMISDFTIYRSTKRYEGCTIDYPPQQNITWENTIKDFFTPVDVECMRWRFNLDEKESVKYYAGVIFAVVKDGTMPPGESSWNTTKVAIFKKWMCSGFP